MARKMAAPVGFPIGGAIAGAALGVLIGFDRAGVGGAIMAALILGGVGIWAGSDVGIVAAHFPYPGKRLVVVILLLYAALLWLSIRTWGVRP